MNLHYQYSIEEFNKLSLPDVRLNKESTLLQHALDFSADGSSTFETKHVKKDGTIVDVFVRTSPFNFGSRKAHIVLIEDISERKKSEQFIWHQANFDLLTDLPNRSLFFDRLSQEISKSRRNHKLVALLYLDLDGFKPVNDLYGHLSGDEVLKTVAKRWLGSVREMDTVVRLGGDEFAVILGELDTAEEVVAVAKKLIASVNVQISLPNNQKCYVGTSIGIAIYPSNATEMDSLLIAADEAMYSSKKRGKNTFTFSERIPIQNGQSEKWMEFSDLNIVGVAIVDEQHREIIQKVNTLNEAISTGQSDQNISAELESLIKYVKHHFVTEECLMTDYLYPQQLLHEFEHQEFLNGIGNLVADFHHGKEMLVMQKLKDWFISHIQNQDKPMGQFLVSKGLGKV